MSQINGWLLVVMTFEFALGMFMLFAASELAWTKRAIGAVAGLGFLIMFLALLYAMLAGQTQHFQNADPKALIGLFLFVNFFGFLLVRSMRKRGISPSCGGTILKMLGCAAVGAVLTIVIVIGIAGMAGLAG